MGGHEMIRSGLMVGGAVAALWGWVPAFAQAAADEAEAQDIVVTANHSRIPLKLKSSPGSVTIVSAEEIAKQTKFGNDLGELLQRAVPGFGVSSSGSYSNFGQTLRGRKPAVFIDGVPTTTPLRDGGRDLRLISPGAISRVEVIRGATALYGLGGAGGIINFATKDPDKEGVRFQTDVATGFSLTHPGDSLNLSVDQSVSGRAGAIGFVLSGYYEKYNSLFNADGKRILPNPQLQGGIADTDSYNLYGKLVFNLTPEQRISVSGNYYKTLQDTGYTNRLGVGRVGSIETPSRAGEPAGRDEYTRNWVAIASYEHDDIGGSALNIQAFTGKYAALFAYYPLPYYPPAGGQTEIRANRWGVRSDVTTPLDGIGSGSNVLWGVDYMHDTTYQLLQRPSFPAALFVPRMRQESIAPFAQFHLVPANWLTLRGGARWENADVKVDGFTTQAVAAWLPGGRQVQGGTLKYEKLLFNLGAVVSPFTEGKLANVGFFAGFSQGFSVGDLGRALATTDAPSIEAFGFKAQIIDSYEAGVRYTSPTLNASVAAFLSTSEFGSTFNASTRELLRAPERVWGIESSLDVTPGDGWKLGASVSWVDGKQEVANVWQKLDTTRIAPVKFTAFVEHRFAGDWMVRVQNIYSGRQSRFPGNPLRYGRADIDAFSLLDASISGPVGPGRLTLAVNNILNEDYFTPDAYRLAENDYFTKGQGATARLSYSVSY